MRLAETDLALSSWVKLEDLSRLPQYSTSRARTELGGIFLNRVSRAISVLVDLDEIILSRVTLAEVGGRGAITETHEVCLADVPLDQADRGACDFGQRADALDTLESAEV